MASVVFLAIYEGPSSAEVLAWWSSTRFFIDFQDGLLCMEPTPLIMRSSRALGTGVHGSWNVDKKPPPTDEVG